MSSKRKKIAMAIWTMLLICGIFVSDRVYAADSDFTIENSILIKYNGNGGSVEIPGGVTEIGPNAFMNCTELSSVAIPDGVKKIGDSAFRGCDKLVDVSIQDSVIEIENQALTRGGGGDRI